MKLESLTDSSIPGYLGQTPVPTVLVFHSKGSKPSRTMLNVVEEVAGGYKGIVRFALVDADSNPEVVDEYGILSLPTYLVFKNSRLCDRFIGTRTKDQLTQRIEKSMETLQG